jgi:hypothetical protein
LYNAKQYRAAELFATFADANIYDPEDQKRVGAYDLYEDLYLNAAITLQIVLRGEDQSPMLMPSSRKIVETTSRFLAVNPQFLVQNQGDFTVQSNLNLYWTDFWAREAIASKFINNKRWGLVRGDAYFYVHAKPQKVSGRRICVEELDPRTVFEIEDPTDQTEVIGVYIVDQVQDLREPDKPTKTVARRRAFRQILDDTGAPQAVSSELRFFEIGKWDDRSVGALAKQEEVKDAAFADLVEEEFLLEDPITALPVYKWRTRPMQNTTWGTSILAGMETLIYGINQSLSDEDATLVFQGLGMYVTNAPPPFAADGVTVGDWNIGPKQIIEIGTDQMFQRVTGVTDVTAMQSHMGFMDEKGISEGAGVPEVAIGRVDVNIAESGIALQLSLMPLIASNAEIELEILTTMDQMMFDITTMWLPAYEDEIFGDVDAMSQMSVVTVFDDPMPKNRDAQIQEVVLLDTSNLILKSMSIAKLRDLGWVYPTADPNTGAALTDDDIAAMLLAQTSAFLNAGFPAGGDNGDGTDDGSDDGTDDGTDDGSTDDTGDDQQTVDIGKS